MSRAFWFAVGAGSGVYAVVKTRRAVDRLTPDALGDALGATGVGVRLFADEVRRGMAEREITLRRQLGLPQPGGSPPTLTAVVTERGVA